ncbi:MAG TPA: DevR family CRISPR-associated autoregulator [Pyrinomonadaceae bacterium]|nr:DevR family CRISPR-associated autoregulator [Pyrinomonadaceae bacterium]
MSKHLFGLVVTPYGTAANNRGENDGNVTTLQKLLWKGDVHTTVSAEAIRWALRYFWERNGDKVNRRWNEETYDHDWRDTSWTAWTSRDEDVKSTETFIDDDVMGFMLAEAASTDGSDVLDTLKEDKKKLDAQLKAMSKEEKKSKAGRGLQQQVGELKSKIDALSKGKTDKRRGALEVTRALSLSAFAGDITFNAKSGEKTNTSLYGTEVHATRYQYGFALTPGLLREASRVTKVIDAIVSLRDVGGNHSRFLFDFSPDSVVFRWTDDFAPRILYSFEMDEKGKVSFPTLVEKIKDGDIDPKELFIGGSVVRSFDDETREALAGANVSNGGAAGIKAAADALKSRIQQDLGLRKEN